MGCCGASPASLAQHAAHGKYLPQVHATHLSCGECAQAAAAGTVEARRRSQMGSEMRSQISQLTDGR